MIFGKLVEGLMTFYLFIGEKPRIAEFSVFSISSDIGSDLALPFWK
jgi:hypothetical protein